MSVYVRRDIEGKIEIIARHPYEDENGPADEELPDDHPDVVEYRARIGQPS